MLLAAVGLSVLALLSVPLVHEAGHALAALVVGGEQVRFARRRGLRFTTSAKLPEGALARRAFYAGGPLGNLIACAALVVLARGLTSAPSLLVLAGGAALAHLAFALVNLLPLEGYDGRGLFRAVSGRTRASSGPRGGSGARA